MSIYTIKKVPVNEVDKLESFIDNHWKKGHALVKSRALLDFQHLNKDEKCYNFIVAENNETKEYDALVGFIPTSQYDKNLAHNGDYWGAIWKFREDISNDEINNAAFYIWKRIFKQPSFQSYAAIGISQIAKRIYEVSRIPVAILSQYYIANESMNEFVIGENLAKGSASTSAQISTIRVVDIDCIEDVEATYRPAKSVEYLKNRYQQHPIYKYMFWGIYTNILEAVFVVRKVDVGDSCVLRVVDVLGNMAEIGNIYDDVQKILNKYGAEYLDFMNFGIEKSIFTQMGFHQLDLAQNDIILPNYFEPFEKRNVIMEVAYKANYDNYVAFKGDSDQDRPNVL